MVEKAYAKLNLSLDVLGRAANGYHDLRSVMQSVAFGDDLEIELTGGEFSIDPGQSYLPGGRKKYRAERGDAVFGRHRHGARASAWKSAYRSAPAWAEARRTPRRCCGP